MAPYAILAVVLGAFPPSPVPSTRPALPCSIFSMPFRDGGATVFLAQPLDSTTLVPTDSAAGWGTRRVPVREPGPVTGHLARVRSLRGSAPEDVRRFLARGDSNVIVVRWGVGSDCSLQAIPGPFAASKVLHYVAHLRPPHEWVHGTPVFDVTIGYWTIYPFGQAFPFGLKPHQYLTTAEFADFYDALPAGAEVERDCPAAVRPLRQWARDHATLARRYPARDVIKSITCRRRR